MILDCHTHIASSKVIPASFVAGMGDNLVRNAPDNLTDIQKEYLRNMLYGLMHKDEDCDLLIAEMDKAGIDKSVLLIIDFGIAFPDDFPPLEEVYLLHKRILEKYPDRFIVFAGIDPRRGKEGLALFEKSIDEWGFQGLKLYPPCGFYPSDKIMFPYLEIAQDREIPVLTHTGPTSPSLSFKYSVVDLMDEAAFNFPKLNFILAHAAFIDYEAAAVLAEYRPNIYLDVSGFTNALRMDRFKSILELHKKRGILNKILFGTDWPIHRLNGNQQKLVELFVESSKDVLTEKELEDILYNNVKRILKT